MKLFKITLKGLTRNEAGYIAGISYVVASDPNSAYEIVRSALEKQKLGSVQDRELNIIELLAEDDQYAICGTTLYYQK